MTKATELRIGNLIEFGRFQNGDFKIGEINAISKHEICVENRDERYLIQDCCPIPLTEEWLLKFGFEKQTEQNQRYKIREGKFQFGEFVMDGDTLCIETDYYSYELAPLAEIHFVHKLQNLYLALTGEVLTIKEDSDVQRQS